MGLMHTLFGGGAAAPASLPPPSRFQAPKGSGSDGGPSVPPAGAMRRELLRLALRQSLTKNGIPTSWIVSQAVDVPGRDGPSGVHVRLLLQHWGPRLLPYTLSFQHDMEQRLLAVEPQAHDWLRGFSWQYADGGGELLPMPDPAIWAEAPAATEAAPLPLERPSPG